MEPENDDPGKLLVAGVICLIFSLPLFYSTPLLGNMLMRRVGLSGNHSFVDYILGGGAAVAGIVLLFMAQSREPELDPAVKVVARRQRRFALFFIAGASVVVGFAVAALALYASATMPAGLIDVEAVGVEDPSDVSLGAKATIWRTGGINVGLDSVPPSYDNTRGDHFSFKLPFPTFTTSTWDGRWTFAQATRFISNSQAARRLWLHIGTCEKCKTKPITVSAKDGRPCVNDRKCKREDGTTGPCPPYKNCYEVEVEVPSSAKFLKIKFDFTDKHPSEVND